MPRQMDLVGEVRAVFEHGHMFGLEDGDEVAYDLLGDLGCNVQLVVVVENVRGNADVLDVLYGDGLDEEDRLVECFIREMESRLS